MVLEEAVMVEVALEVKHLYVYHQRTVKVEIMVNQEALGEEQGMEVCHVRYAIILC